MKPIKQIKLFFKLTLFAILVVLVMSSTSWAATYYVDATNGNDSYNGLTPSSAWKTILKVNNTFFQPGDFILFKRDEIWHEQLTVPSSGSETSPITFGAYGIGGDPIIDARNANDKSVLISSKNYITIMASGLNSLSFFHNTLKKIPLGMWGEPGSTGRAG